MNHNRVFSFILLENFDLKEDFPNRKSRPEDEDPKRMDGDCHHEKIGTEYAPFVVLGLDGPDTRCMGR
jgi:hypothetical protein